MVCRRIGGCLVAENHSRSQGRHTETGTSEQEQGGGPAAALGSRPDQGGGSMAKEARVFRAKSRKWVNLVAGLLLSASSATTVAWAVQVPTAPPMERTAPANVVLSRAIDCQRHGDYETAASLFEEAAQRKLELKPAEQEELTRCKEDNSRALKARQEAAELLNQAEKATKEGQSVDASMAFKRLVTVEQYLVPADKVRFQALNKQAMAAKPVAPVDLNKDAHVSLSLGRAQFAMYDFEAAESLAKEAQSLGGKFAPTEDTPQKLLADIARARSDSTTMLKAARSMMQHREYDRAEYYAHQAERTASSFSLAMWGDTPSKVLKEIQLARAQMPTQPKTMIAGTTTAEPKKEAGPAASGLQTVANKTTAQPEIIPDTEGARVLMAQARMALKDGKFDEARRLNELARARNRC